jgi:hypothetical protein
MRPFTTGSDYVNQIGLETDKGSERIKAPFVRDGRGGVGAGGVGAVGAGGGEVGAAGLGRTRRLLPIWW